MTTPLARVAARLTHVEELVDQYVTARRAVIFDDGADDHNVDQLRHDMDDAIYRVVTDWELIGRPDELAQRIDALPGAERARIEAHADPDTTAAFTQLADADPRRPRPLDTPPTPPPFPLHSLPDWTQDHASHVAEQLQVPVDLAAMLIIGALSAALTGRARVKVSANWTEPINLYLVTAMDSGAGKSAAEKLTCQWLRDWQRDRMSLVMDDWRVASRVAKAAGKRVDDVQQGVQKGSQTHEDLYEAIRAADEANAKVPELPRILADDATPEAVANLLAQHGERLAIMSTEADLFDMVLRGKTGSRVNFNIYLKAWSGDSLIRDRKGGSDTGPELTDLAHPLMTVSCTVQPSVLARLSNDEEMAARGFSARFMMAMPEGLVGRRDQAKRFNDTPIPTADTYATTARALATEWANWHRTELTCGPEAQDLIRTYLAGMEAQICKGGRYEHLAEWSSKLFASLARYAGLLHLAEGRSPATPIDAATVERAIDLARYWWATADVVLSMGDVVLEQARAILSWIQREGLTEVKVRDVQRGVQKKALGLDVAVDYVPGLELLVEMGWLSPSDPDWAANVGTNKKSAGYFSAWSESTTESAYVSRVSCQSMGERDSTSLVQTPLRPGPLLTSDTPDISDNQPTPATDPDPVDNSPTRPTIDF